MSSRLNNEMMTALEELRSDLMDIEAFAHAAQSALKELPFLRNHVVRRVLGRISPLLEETAKRAELVLHRTNKTIDVLIDNKTIQ